MDGITLLLDNHPLNAPWQQGDRHTKNMRHTNTHTQNPHCKHQTVISKPVLVHWKFIDNIYVVLIQKCLLVFTIVFSKYYKLVTNHTACTFSVNVASGFEENEPTVHLVNQNLEPACTVTCTHTQTHPATIQWPVYPFSCKIRGTQMCPSAIQTAEKIMRHPRDEVFSMDTLFPSLRFQPYAGEYKPEINKFYSSTCA